MIRAYPAETSPASRRIPARALVEFSLGLIGAALLVLTLLLPHWMELLFGLSPDAGTGSAEYGVALLWSGTSAVMFALAGHTWRKQIRTSSIRPVLER